MRPASGQFAGQFDHRLDAVGGGGDGNLAGHRIDTSKHDLLLSSDYITAPRLIFQRILKALLAGSSEHSEWWKISCLIVEHVVRDLRGSAFVCG